jgi:hypothetical protein
LLGKTLLGQNVVRRTDIVPQDLPVHWWRD